MENVQNGRAIIENGFDRLSITVPARRHWFILAFLCAWLCGWAMGWFFAAKALFSIGDLGLANAFLAIWLTGWTIGGAFAIRYFFWMLFGLEIISLDRLELTVERRGLFLSKPQTFDATQVKRLRVAEKSRTKPVEEHPKHGQFTSIMASKPSP